MWVWVWEVARRLIPSGSEQSSSESCCQTKFVCKTRLVSSPFLRRKATHNSKRSQLLDFGLTEIASPPPTPSHLLHLQRFALGVGNLILGQFLPKTCFFLVEGGSSNILVGPPSTPFPKSNQFGWGRRHWFICIPITVNKPTSNVSHVHLTLMVMRTERHEHDKIKNRTTRCSRGNYRHSCAQERVSLRGDF